MKSEDRWGSNSAGSKSRFLYYWKNNNNDSSEREEPRKRGACCCCHLRRRSQAIKFDYQPYPKCSRSQQLRRRRRSRRPDMNEQHGRRIEEGYQFVFRAYAKQVSLFHKQSPPPSLFSPPSSLSNSQPQRRAHNSILSLCSALRGAPLCYLSPHHGGRTSRRRCCICTPPKRTAAASIHCTQSETLEQEKGLCDRCWQILFGRTPLFTQRGYFHMA